MDEQRMAEAEALLTVIAGGTLSAEEAADQAAAFLQMERQPTRDDAEEALRAARQALTDGVPEDAASEIDRYFTRGTREPPIRGR